MTSTSPTAPHGQASQGVWPLLAPYAVLPVAASLSIVVPFRDLIYKSAQQKGQPLPKMTLLQGMREGLRAAPNVGLIVGTQMVLQKQIKGAMFKEGEKVGLVSELAIAGLVGIASVLPLAVFNGHTMGLSVRASLSNLSKRQSLAIAVQETAFVGGLAAADQLSGEMKKWGGDNKAVKYTAAFMAGAAGSLAGHPANTALTLWQSGMKVTSLRQLTWGAARKARGVGVFSVTYTFVKELFQSTVEKSH